MKKQCVAEFYKVTSEIDYLFLIVSSCQMKNDPFQRKISQ